jgi:FAD/FMN-containing dehydrogenase/Fe-S oxidoreductase
MSTSSFVLLPSSHARIHDTFPEAHALEQQLRATIRGEVRFDAASKALYATDGSNYRHIPIGVVIPRDEADVIATVAACRAVNAPLLSRGAGTSLAGQGCNTAVILDFSKYMNGMGPIDPKTRTVHVQPGIVLDRVRDAAEKFALTFAPDPATHSRCTIGGMIGNNSCGVHALMGGKTVDNIHSLDLLLYDGTRLTVGPTTEAELESHIKTGGRTGEIYAALKGIRDTYADQVRAKFPRIPRRVSGFNLDELLPENNFNLARALVGSEGTCAVILGATLQLVESPQCRTLVGVGFPDIFLAADNVPQILEHKPIGLEGVDGYLLEALRSKQKSVEDLKLLPGGDGFLIVEFGAATQPEANSKARAFVASMKALPAQPTSRIYTSDEAKRVWHIRESGLGATAFIPGPNGKSTTGWEGWEDAAVDPAQLGSYLRAIHALINEYNYSTAMYGHFGQGCVHMRLNFDLETPAGILKFRQFIDRAADIALAHGGSLSGEHGDGQARGALLPKMFGEDLMEAFRSFKRIFDPTNRMNPGKLIDAHQPHEDLRLGADYKPWQPKTHFAYAEDNGSFASANLRCVGVGACRKTDAGTMCPSFMATGEELHSTRGRAHLLWELMQGEILPNQWQNKQVKESLDLCLSCKACKSECPVSVDMATYKSEFLSHFYEGQPRPLSHYAFARIDRFAQLASFAPTFVNAINKTPILNSLLKKILHIHPNRSLPRFSRPFTPDRRLARDARRRRDRRNPLPADAPEVFLWADTFNNYFHPSTLRAAHQVLTTAGFRVTLPNHHLCCGRPLYDFGMLDTAKKYLLKILDALSPQLVAGTPIVVLEPSCASVFRDELTNLFPNDPRATQLRNQTLLLSEFLVKHAPHYRPPQLAKSEKILVHGHCHHRATMGMVDELALLYATGADVQLLDSGCCGMAGPFGFEKEKYELSQKLGERVLLPAIRNNTNAIIVSDGFSCSEQITQNTNARPMHLAEVLAQSSNL